MDLEAAADHEPSGFFVLRSPLLALDEYLAWGADLTASSAWAGGDDLGRAVEADKKVLRERLREILVRPEVKEAIYLASPILVAQGAGSRLAGCTGKQ